MVPAIEDGEYIQTPRRSIEEGRLFSPIRALNGSMFLLAKML
jgi:hypothetical protein